MMKRLGEYVSAKPKRAAQIILTLAAALIITVAGMFIYALDLRLTDNPPADSPYPSEVTPLSLVEDGIMWMRDINIVVGTHGMNYSEFRCGWGYWMNNSVDFASGDLVSDDGQSELSKGVNATTDTYFGTVTPWYDAPNMTISFCIHDVTGDGAFGSGDFIVRIDAPRTEGIVYRWALAYVYDVTMAVEYSYAFQDGVFYSWLSSELPTQGPWWEP